MTSEIYQQLQNIIPELNAQDVLDSNDFDDFSEWINEKNQLFHYIELKEYYDNGIEDNFYFNKLNVDTEQLQANIDAEISQLVENFEDDGEFSFDDGTDMMEKTEEIIFDTIKNMANQHQLSLLVIHRENPYWLLVPTQNQKILNEIVETFNQIFNIDNDLPMVVY